MKEREVTKVTPRFELQNRMELAPFSEIRNTSGGPGLREMSMLLATDISRLRYLYDVQNEMR